MKTSVAIITGPTCCGKTDAAIKLAEKIDGEIISFDSVLVYRGMDIGSAKPSCDELKKIPHHLIDVADVSEKFDVARYVELAQKALAKIIAKGKKPIVAGGSGFYLKAWFSAVADNVKIADDIKNFSKKIEIEEGAEGLKKALLKIDPNAAECVDINNPRRVKNALERCAATGKSAKQLLEEFKSLPCPLGNLDRHLTILDLPDEKLRARISARTKSMVANGIIDETRALIKRGLLINPSASTAIGYRETIMWLQNNESDTNALIETISNNTMALVKKQRKFFRNNLR